MSDGMLQDILEVERQIEAELTVERDKARQWLLQEKAEIDRQAEAEIEQSASTVAQSSKTRCQSARDAGACRIREMRNHVQQLRGIADTVLMQTLRRHLSQMFGGGRHDYPDGQN